ncbi:Serine/threonine protein kinase [Handroanthus impetiginosus]|uniref:Serine/threonine protein kinase n=1 Tax=Handroanthus impetiginosus TaxID=429701 RepID=A0A2G9GHN0_9LAMI|nr:Serine/threonine protein kinase [Handroanthus impetiginosus]
MNHIKTSLIVALFSLLLSTTNSETIEARNALVQFMQKLSPNPEVIWGWNTTSDPCNHGWKGVSCHNNSLTIKKIVLDGLNLTGQIDATFLCVPKNLKVISINSNNVSGTFPEEISKCRQLTHIYIHENNLTGSLPVSLSQLSNLKTLDVSKNGFSGNIPDVSRISGLVTFLAQDNKLSGELPAFDFSNLDKFNVSNNNLSGTVPDFLGKFNETSFLNNPGLCGKSLSKFCPSQAKKKGLSKKDYFIYVGCTAIGVIVVSLVAFKLIKKRTNKEKKNIVKKGFGRDSISTTSSDQSNANRSEFSITSPENGKASRSLVVLSNPVVNELKFDELLRSPAELVGRGRRGSLYKVKLNEGVILAVKRIRDWDISIEEFKKRMHRIDEVKHPNVMPILAFYCSRQEKLLVYEFQQSGNLFRLLHGSQNSESFDWESRLIIAAKISAALAFMHKELQADKIPHGNLKSSNILFNNKMEPFISEYGLAEVNNQDQSFPAQIDASQEINSPAPNNAFHADSYNFGIILIELLTGKQIQNNAHDLLRWVNTAITEEWTVEVFDKKVVSEGTNEEQMVSLLQLALKCTSSSAEARPTFGEIAEIISSIKKEYEEKFISSDI